MNIECPSCSTNNKMNFMQDIVCGECKKPLAGHSYKRFKKPLISATTALIIGIYGTYKVDEVFFEDQRYSIGTEYELISSCVNASNTTMDLYSYKRKTQRCICALEKTPKQKESDSEFSSRFLNNINLCP